MAQLIEVPSSRPNDLPTWWEEEKPARCPLTSRVLGGFCGYTSTGLLYFSPRRQASSMSLLDPCLPVSGTSEKRKL